MTKATKMGDVSTIFFKSTLWSLSFTNNII